MSKTDKIQDSGSATRRSFLKGAAVTTAAVSGGALTANAVAAPTTEKTPALKQGYQETEHVRDYYRLARF